MKKRLALVIGFVAVLAAGIGVNNHLSHKNYKQPTPEQVAAAKKAQADAIANMKEKDRLQKLPVCNEPITVTIADMTLVMPRGWATEFRTKDGQVFDHMNRRCEIKKLDNVTSVRQIDIFISAVTENNQYRTSYQTYISQIEALRAKGLSRMLPNDVEEIKNGHQYFFVFPPSLIPTANGESVVFDCGSVYDNQLYSPGNCSTSYLYRHNLALWYRYFGLRNSKTLQVTTMPHFGLYDQVKADRYYRNLIEGWIKTKE